jgi:hypothetical protein
VQYANSQLGPNSPQPGHGPEAHGPSTPSPQPSRPPSPQDQAINNATAAVSGAVASQPQQSQPQPQAPAASTTEPDKDDTDGWRNALVELGWEETTATLIAGHHPDEPISESLREEMASQALAYYDGDFTAVLEAWKGTGFEPQPGLPASSRPRPTGHQLLRYLRKMNLKDKRAQAAART